MNDDRNIIITIECVTGEISHKYINNPKAMAACHHMNNNGIGNCVVVLFGNNWLSVFYHFLYYP